MDKIERNERQQNAAKEPEEWEENVDEEEEKELRRMAIQLGLCHLAKFKEAAEYGGKGMDGDDKMEVDDPTTSTDGNDFNVQNRKALWSLLRAIRCLHGRHPKLEAQCFREGALYINKLADTQKGMQKEMQLNLRNIFARLLYKQ